MPSTNIPLSTPEINPCRTISGNTKRSQKPRLTPRYRGHCRRISGLTELQHHRLQRGRAKLRSMPDGKCEWSMSQWAAFFKISRRQFQRDANAWEEHGHIQRIPRTGNDYPCDTYLWMLPTLTVVGGVDINVRKLPVLNTNTTVPPASVEVPLAPPAPPAEAKEAPAISYHQVKWEWHRQRNHPPKKRELYEYNGLLIRQNSALRGIVRGKHNGRGGPDPLVGARGVMPDGHYSGEVRETEEERLYREDYRVKRIQNEHKMNAKFTGYVNDKSRSIVEETS